MKKNELTQKALDRYNKAVGKYNRQYGGYVTGIKNSAYYKNYLSKLNPKNALSYELALVTPKATKNIAKFSNRQQFYKELYRLEAGYKQSSDISAKRYKKWLNEAYKKGVDNGQFSEAQAKKEMDKIKSMSTKELRTKLLSGEMKTVSDVYRNAYGS